MIRITSAALTVEATIRGPSVLLPCTLLKHIKSLLTHALHVEAATIKGFFVAPAAGAPQAPRCLEVPQGGVSSQGFSADGKEITPSIRAHTHSVVPKF